MNSKKHWAPRSGVTVHRIARNGSAGWVVFCLLVQEGICPICRSRSQRRHGWRHRRLQDFPTHGEAVTVELRVCRWRCTSAGCRRVTFSDQVPSVAFPYARRTSRAARIASHLGHAAGGRPAERLMHRLGIPVRDDTILRHLKRDARNNVPRARIIGLDDWSWRTSTQYATVIVDLERCTVVDIPEDRDVASCTEWLRRHPTIEIISSDRCGLYAQTARQGAPQALQVPDRFHLVQNLRMEIEGKRWGGRPSAVSMCQDSGC